MQSLDIVLGGIRREEIPENTIIFLEKLLRCENLTNLRAISLGKKDGNSTLRLTGIFPYIEQNVGELQTYLNENGIPSTDIHITPPIARLSYSDYGIILILNLVRLYDTPIRSS